MRKIICIVLFSLFAVTTSLFAASSYKVCDGWTLVQYSNGVFGLNDDSRGICYDISISSVGSAFRVCVENWVEDRVAKTAIKVSLEAGLKAIGIAARVANPVATAIVLAFEPSKAY